MFAQILFIPLDVAFLGFGLLMVLANLFAFRSLRERTAPNPAPMVSILVPARNEALNIEACVGSLLVQDYPNWELVVLDDHSEDGTGGMVRALYAKSPSANQARLLQGETLPPGWTGKNWACHQLSRAAKGEFLLFTDADTTHAPGAVTAAVVFARETKADLVSAWPRFITKTLGEKLIIPIIVLLGFAFCAHWLVALLQRFPRIAARLGSGFTVRLGTANGQFMFFTRAGYERIGGHEGVKENVVEDVALGRKIAAQIPFGMRLYNCDSIRFSTVRMYRSFAQTWAGFTKNIRAVFERERLLFWVFLLGMWSLFLMPCFKWMWASPERWDLALIKLGLVVAIRILITVRFRLTWIGAALHPLGVVLFIGIALNSWWASRTTGVTWKGRVYQPRV